MSGQQLQAVLGFRLVTADLPRLAAFYTGVLGLPAEGDVQAVGAEEMALLGLAGGGRRQVLAIGEQRLAIDQFEAAGRPYPADSDAASLAFQHLALVVTDIAAAHARLRDIVPISTGGPQHLPPASGGAHAFKFRDPDGHPLELLQFPPDNAPHAWSGRAARPGQIALGVDHSAISVGDGAASVAFYGGLGLDPGKRTLNQGPAQQHLDGLSGVEVSVIPMLPATRPPHLELLAYRVPRPAAAPAPRPNDVAATRVVWRGARAALLADPDGHLQQIEP